MEAGGAYRFDEFVIDLGQRSLARCGARVPLQPRTFDLLAYFVTHPGVLHTKQRLLDEVWREAVVTESSLTRGIRQLRIALEDTANGSRYVETVPRTGYRFIADVCPVDAADVTPPPAGFPRLRLASAAALAVIAVAVLTSIFRPAAPETERVAAPPAIAVLPFVNMSNDPDNQFLSDGISEEILNRLAAIRDLRVIARTSSFAFKDSGFDVPRLCTLLGVDYLVQGSVRKEGQRLRITAQLVDDTGVQIWSNAFDRELTAIFDIQSDIAAAVAANVSPHVSPNAARAPPPDIEAYQHYLIGREILRKRLPNFVARAPEQFLRALEIDPDYAEAHAELAIAWILGTAWSPDAGEQLRRAQQEIDAALALKPNLARAHAARGLLLEQRIPVDFPAAERALRKALALNPNLVDARNWLAGLLRAQGRSAESLVELRRAAGLDPLAATVNVNLAMTHAERGDFAQAERRLQRLVELPYPQVFAHSALVELYFLEGRLADSTQSAKNLALAYLDGRGRPGLLSTLGLAYARLGMWDTARFWQRRVEREWPEHYQVAFHASPILRLEGRHDEMLERYRAVFAANDLELAQVHRRHIVDYGIVQAMTGDYAGAVRTLDGVLGPDVRAAWQIVRGMEAQHALAWAYLETGATESAKSILEDMARYFREREAEGILHLSDELMLFAQNALLAGDPNLAIDRMAAAVAAGWRDYYAVAGDPRWQSILEEPRFRALMARVKVDVDAQRARVEQIDANDDFGARLERLIAAQAPRG